jgi:hypothetical protein
VLNKAVTEIKRLAASKDKQMKEAAKKTLVGKHGKQVCFARLPFDPSNLS